MAVESKRVRTFRFEIAKCIPKFPNNRASLEALKSKSLGALLVDYTNWCIRYVAPRPRALTVEKTACADPRWRIFSKDIDRLLQKVENGEDLTPFLSLLPHTRGFTPASATPGPDIDRWADKDMLLNVMGYHHFHLDAAPNNNKRSDIVVFAHITRDRFTVVGVFDHSVFANTELNASMTAERERLWTIFDEISTSGAPPESMVAQAMITTSGHSLYAIQL